MKQTNRIKNGGFSSGNFDYWRPRGYDTPITVELREGNFAARMVGGRNQGQNLAAEIFSVKPGAFKFDFDIEAPEAVPIENTQHRTFHIQGRETADNPLINAFVVYTIWMTNDQGESTIWTSWRYVDRQSQTITVEGITPEGYGRVDIQIAIPSDPFGNKGCYFLDNFQFLTLD